MEIKEFGNILKEEISKKLGKGYTIRYTDVLKNNGISHAAIMIQKEGESVSPTIYLDSYYDEYRRGKVLSGIVESMIDIYRQAMPKEDIDISFYKDFSVVSERLFFKLVNYEKNEYKLKDIPYKRILDLAMVPLFSFSHSSMGEGNITVTNSHLETWEVSKEELWENVADRAPEIAPIKIRGLMDVMEKITGESLGTDVFAGMYVVSTRSENLGAAAVLYPDVLKGLSDDHESDLYIIPSSIHECIVFPVDGTVISPKELMLIIREVNSTTVKDEDILSDNLYLYKREEDRFMLAKEA